MEQVTIFELYPKAVPVPALWECMKTCKNCGIYMSHFPGTDKPRCDYGINQPGIGTSGKDLYSKLIDNCWHIYCKFYEPKD